MNSQAPFDKWVFVGKAATVIGILIGLISLWNSLNPKGPHLISLCNSTDLSIIGMMLDQEAKQRETKLHIASDETKVKGNNNKTEIQKQSDLGPPKTFSATIFLVKGSLGSYQENYLMTCRISNIGTEQAEDVVLDLPDRPTRVLIGEQHIEYSEIAKSIKLGTIRPGPELRVSFTHSNHNMSFASNSDRLHLNFKGGVGEIDYGQQFHGFARKIAKFVTYLIEDIFSFLLFISILVFSFFLCIGTLLKKLYVQENPKK